MIATAPDVTDAKPVTCPRSPFGRVRPSTSLTAMDDSERDRANVPRATSTPTAAAVPSRRATTAAIAAVAIVIPTWPAAQMTLRRGARRTNGTSSACGSSDPDSRTGTSRPTSTAGAPSAANSQASTVLASTTTSPTFCSVKEPRIRSPLAGTRSSASAGRSSPAARLRTTTP